MPHLKDVNAIIHIKRTLLFDGNCKTFVQQIKEDISPMGFWSTDCKIINLPHEDNMIAIDDTRVQTWFMNGWCESNFMQDSVSMLFPKTGRSG